MACPDFELHVDGRRGIGVLQQQGGLDYPLVTPSEDIRYLLADVYFEYEDPADYGGEGDYVLPLAIAWAYGLGCVESDPPSWAPTPTHDADLVLKDAAGTIVFDSTTADFDVRDWNEAYTVYEWRTDRAVCRLVAYSAWSTTERAPQPRNHNLHLEPERAVIDSRCVHRIPARVRSVRVVLDTIEREGLVLATDNNVRIDVEDRGFRAGRRRETILTFHAIPGEGTGRYTSCEEGDNPIRRIAGVGPNEHGDVFIAATDCLWLRQPLTLTDESPRTYVPTRSIIESAPHLLLGNDCGPCCTCEEMVDSAQFMNQLRNEYKAIATRVNASVAGYHTARQRWLDGVACREAQPLRLVVLPQSGAFVDVAGQFCNQTDQCQTNLILVFQLSTTPDGVEPTISCNATRISRGGATGEPYVVENAFPIYRAYWDSVDPMQSVNVRFRLRFPNNGLTDAGEPVALSVLLTASLNGTALQYDASPITVEKAATLNAIDNSC